jgi:hypothetical protein
VPLVAYLAAVHAVGVTGGDERTVALLSIAAIAGQLTATGRNTAAARSTAFAGAAVLLLVFVPALRHRADLGSPDVALVLLSLAGSSLSVWLAGLAMRRRRGGDAARAAAA